MLSADDSLFKKNQCDAICEIWWMIFSVVTPHNKCDGWKMRYLCDIWTIPCILSTVFFWGICRAEELPKHITRMGTICGSQSFLWSTLWLSSALWMDFSWISMSQDTIGEKVISTVWTSKKKIPLLLLRDWDGAVHARDINHSGSVMNNLSNLELYNLCQRHTLNSHRNIKFKN